MTYLGRIGGCTFALIQPSHAVFGSVKRSERTLVGKDTLCRNTCYTDDTPASKTRHPCPNKSWPISAWHTCLSFRCTTRYRRSTLTGLLVIVEKLAVIPENTSNGTFGRISVIFGLRLVMATSRASVLGRSRSDQTCEWGSLFVSPWKHA